MSQAKVIGARRVSIFMVVATLPVKRSVTKVPNCACPGQRVLLHRPAQTTNINEGISRETEICEVIEGVFLEENPDLHAITNFSGEACVSTSVADGKSDTFRSRKVREVQQATSYLERPSILQTSTDVTGVAGSLLASLNITTPAIITQVNKHVLGAAGYRMGLKFIVQVNSTPYIGGVLKLCWLPFPSDGSYAGNQTTQTDISKLPGVYLDLRQSTMAELYVPWLSPFEYAPYNAVHSYGIFILAAFTSIAIPSGNSPPKATVYWSMHDVELIGALNNGPVTGITPQAGGEDVVVDKPISTMLLAASSVARLVARNVPFISAYVQPVSWWTAYLGKKASAFGFSKPLYTLPTQRMLLTNNALHQNTDTADTSASLALTMGNQLALLPGFAASQIDEMAISYVVSRPSSICRFTFDTANVYSDYIYACRCCPSVMFMYGTTPYNAYTIQQSTTTPTLKQGCAPSYLCYLANSFAFWKGDLRFKFISNSTCFHSGRLRISFQPFADEAYPFTNSFTHVNSFNEYDEHSAIWDLKAASTFEFCCPFTSPLAYLPTTSSCGNLFVTVIETLNAASTVVNNVEITVLVSGGDNFEFAMPITPICPPAPPGVVLVGQAGGDVCVVPGTSRSTDCLHAMGERLVSLKQLITKACGYAYGTGGDQYVNSFYYIQAQAYQTTDYSNAVGTPFCQYFASMYAFARGSTLFDVFIAGVTPNNFVNSIVGAYVPTMPATALAGGISSCNGVQFEKEQIHVRIPYNNSSSRVRIRQGLATTYDLNTPSLPAPTPEQALIRVYTNTPIFQRAGDDAQLGYLYGTPYLGFNMSTTTRRRFEVRFETQLNTTA